MPVLTRAPLLAIAAASLAGAFVAGRLTVKPRTVETVREVQAKQTQQAQQQAKVETRTVYVQGPERVRTVRYDCPTGKPSEERIEERGPARTETATNTATVTQVRTQLEYRDRIETRHERDTWAVGASVGMGLDGRRRAQLEVSRHIVGPVHATASVSTDRVVMIGAEWRW